MPDDSAGSLVEMKLSLSARLRKRFEPFHVQQVLILASSLLVLNEMLARQDCYGFSSELCVNTSTPRLVELHTIDGRNHVDAYRSYANLKMVPGVARSAIVRSAIGAPKARSAV